MEQDRIKLYQGMVADGNYHKDIDAFNSQYFSNDATVKDLWKKLIKNRDYTKTLKDFYTKYVCDLSWAKKTTYCGGSGSGGNTTTSSWDNYPCVVELAKSKGVSADKNNAYTINGFKYYSNGRKIDTKGVKSNFTCNDPEFIKSIGSGSHNGGGSSSSNENSVSNGIYTTKGDPYQYKIVNCVWYTKGKSITDWKSLEDNQKATDILDERFPNARKKCKKTKTDNTPPKVIDTTPINLPEWATCLKDIQNLKLSQDSKGEDIVIEPFGTGGDLGYFWNDNTFLYVSKNGNKVYGKWSCKNNSLVIKTDDGQVWMQGSGWSTTPDKIENQNPDQNFGTSWTTPDELSGTNEPKKVNDTLTQNESTMDNLENIINEVNSLIIEQTQQVVQAPADELNTLETNSLLKNTGTLESLCRTNNGTSKPVNVNGKTYFAGKSFTLKSTNTPAYLTFDGYVLQRVGNSCNFIYVTDKDGNFMHIKGIPYSDLAVQQTDILNKFGINPLDYNSDPYYFIKTITTKFQNLIDQKARSMVFKSWNDMLTYWDPKGTHLTGDETTFSYPPNDELNQYRLVTADNLGIKYLDKQVQIYIPLEAAVVTGAKKIKYEPVQCQLELKTYLTAAFEYQMNGQNDPNIDVNTVRENLRGCYSHGMFDKDKFKGFQQNDLDIQFSKENNPFKWWKQGSVLSMNNIKELLTGSSSALPLVSGGRKNPYLNFNIDTMRESKIKLNKLIKENLQKLSEQKNSNLLAETKIIQTRTKILTENRTLKLKQPREKFFNEIISEAIYLESQGFDKQLIKEEFWDTLKGMFGQHGSEAIFGTFKEYMGKWLLQKLTPVNPNGWIGSIIVATIGNLHIDDLSKLTDCNFLTKKIASSIGEGIARKIQHDKGFDGGISDIVRNGLFSAIDNNEMVKSLETGLAKLICPALSGVKTKLEDKAQQMKTMAVQA